MEHTDLWSFVASLDLPVLVGRLLCSGRGRLLVVAHGRIFCLFNAFHEGNDFLDAAIQWIEALSVHLSLPRLGSPEQDDVDEFVIAQGLCRTCAWGNSWNFLGVNTREVVSVFSCFHIERLAAFSAQVSFDLLEALEREIARNGASESRIDIVDMLSITSGDQGIVEGSVSCREVCGLGDLHFCVKAKNG